MSIFFMSFLECYCACCRGWVRAQDAKKLMLNGTSPGVTASNYTDAAGMLWDRSYTQAIKLLLRLVATEMLSLPQHRQRAGIKRPPSPQHTSPSYQ